MKVPLSVANRVRLVFELAVFIQDVANNHDGSESERVICIYQNENKQMIEIVFN